MIKKTLVGILVTMGLAVTANSQTYLDFATYANGNEHGVDPDGTRELINGLYVEFSATSSVNEQGGYAYFDSGNAGLGVCATLTGSAQCNPTNDDNLTSGETLTISFWDALTGGNQFTDVTLSNLVFRSANHNIITDATSTLLFAAGQTVDSGDAATFLGLGSQNGADFTFGYGGRNPDQYYVSSMMVSGVPEPSTWLMMIIGFGIVASSARRSRRHSGSIQKTC